MDSGKDSTENAAYTLIDNKFKAWNSKLHIRGIFCDLAKAFVQIMRF